MNQRQSKFRSFNANPGLAIPVKFGTDLPLLLPIKIQTPDPRENPLLVPEKPLVPALFLLATADGPTLKAPAVDRTFLGEMMLDAKRLEAVLQAIVRRKKTTTRRVSAGRFDKSISINDGPTA